MSGIMQQIPLNVTISAILSSEKHLPLLSAAGIGIHSRAKHN